MEKENYQMHGQASQDLFYWTKGHLTDIHGPGGDWRRNKQPQDPTLCGQICGSMCLIKQEAKRSKSEQSRNQSSITSDNYVVSSWLNQKMKNSNTPRKTLVESWKFRCQQQCLVKHQQIAAGKSAAILGNTRPNMLVLSMPTNLWEDDWKVCRTGITKITSLQKEDSLSHYNLFRCLKHKKHQMRRLQWKRIGKLEKIPAWQLTSVRNKKDVFDEARNKGRKVHFGIRNWTTISKIQRQSRTPRWLVKMIQDCTQYWLNKDHQRHRRQPQKSWTLFRDYWDAMRRTSSRCSIRLYPGQNGRCTDVIENSKFRMPRHLDTSTETQMAQIVVQYGRSSRSSGTKSVRSSSGRTVMGTAIWESSIEKNPVGKKFQIGNVYSLTEKNGLFLSVYVDDIKKLAGEKQNISPTWKLLTKDVDLGGTNIPGPCLFGLNSKRMSDKQGYWEWLQKYVRIKDFRRGYRKIAGNKSHGETWCRNDIFMVQWHGKSCKEMRGQMLRTCE